MPSQVRLYIDNDLDTHIKFSSFDLFSDMCLANDAYMGNIIIGERLATGLMHYNYYDRALCAHAQL